MSTVFHKMIFIMIKLIDFTFKVLYLALFSYIRKVFDIWFLRMISIRITRYI